MKHTKRFLVLFFSFLVSALFVLTVPSVGLAQGGPDQDLDPCTTEAGSGDPNATVGCQVKDLGIGAAIGQLIQFIFVVAVILALGFLVFGGIKWITSGGDKANVESARGTIIAAIIGLIIVFLAYFILNFILFFLTGNYISAINIPSLSSLPGA